MVNKLQEKNKQNIIRKLKENPLLTLPYPKKVEEQREQKTKKKLRRKTKKSILNIFYTPQNIN